MVRRCKLIFTQHKNTYSKCLVLVEDTNFGIELEKTVVNKLPRQFQDINMKFMLLSRRMQIWIARVILSLLVKNIWFSRMDRQAIAGEIESILEDTQLNIEVMFDD